MFDEPYRVAVADDVRVLATTDHPGLEEYPVAWAAGDCSESHRPVGRGFLALRSLGVRMRLRRSDLTVFVSLFAVVLSGIWVVRRLGIESTGPTFGLIALLAALWTVYFRFAVIPRLEIQASDEREPDRRAGPPDDAE
ncbi:hypothetical protein ACFQE1_09650 [Halobium palmae]|uniref:DUF8074 domain-containing protein n=1 Tax=Halobium palmae TaxID=1776492 RepID=A0ABD5RYX4_9EURY